MVEVLRAEAAIAETVEISVQATDGGLWIGVSTQLLPTLSPCGIIFVVRCPDHSEQQWQGASHLHAAAAGSRPINHSRERKTGVSTNLETK